MMCSKFNSGKKERVRGTERKQENGKGGGSDKDLGYSPDGRELHIYHPPGKCGVKLSHSTLKREERRDKELPLLLSSCRLHFIQMPAAYQRLSPFLPTCPRNAERVSVTCSTTA